MNILDRIKELYPQFTRKQKSIADYMTSNPGDICYITLTVKPQHFIFRTYPSSFLSESRL